MTTEVGGGSWALVIVSGVWIMLRSRCLRVVCLVVLTTGCQNPTAPLVIPSSYVARSVGRMSLPATFLHGGASDVALVADTIHLHATGVAERITIRRHTTVGTAFTVETVRSHESYAVRGHSLFFVRPCVDANCADPPAGVFSVNRRQLHLPLWSSGPVVLYDRISP